MNISRDSIKKAVKTCIVELVHNFQSQPYSFLFESDIQAYLYASLRSRLSEPLKVHGSGNPENVYNTGIVHTEYWKRIDIVCLDPESEQWSKKRTFRGSDLHIYELPILVGIELKYCKMGDIFGLSSCIADLEKLNAHKIKYPVALGFLQNRSYEEAFFAGLSHQYECIDVSDIDPFGFHVISPGKVWKIHISQIAKFDKNESQ